MKLKEKTHKKFVEFFSEKCRTNPEQDFELAFSEIQRITGTASVTLKRALTKLVEEGFITMVPGRNSRYARFTVNAPERDLPVSIPQEADRVTVTISSLEHDVDLLKRRLRGQEIAIGLLQDRLADFEDKLKL